ncbi:RNA 2',3'-cyclic phosphodiesterase [Paenibacillus pini]|uniref:RNA 2',3'-cyclic phosphodiesterase n=1 Tax=Paenibacillus pini JCM 16418 TaxID=1236976 RepID=W7YHW5_9BACL|nr:RNA 2',3'-cyclic phosphodiesterase [Paenibacillus pini]GAF08052.1 2'-5' RNA ligase [Paenibacillus pini JCM 16418]
MCEEGRNGNDSQPLRVFVAIRVPAWIQQQLHEWKIQHEDQFPFKKWTFIEDYHITLQFLGDVEPKLIPDIIQSLSKVANEFKSFTLQLGDWGTFGLPESPRVLWAGLKGSDTNHALFILQQMVTSATHALGFVTENRPYHPHITISRKYKGNDPFSDMDRKAVLQIDHRGEKARPEALWTVNEFVLFTTRLHVQPMYEILKAFHLGGKKLD